MNNTKGYNKIENPYKEPLIWEKEEYPPETWKVYCNFCNVPETTERIVVNWESIEYFVPLEGE